MKRKQIIQGKDNFSNKKQMCCNKYEKTKVLIGKDNFEPPKIHVYMGGGQESEMTKTKGRINQLTIKRN